jgi:electron transfer flavoprotein alpha subunit
MRELWVYAELLDGQWSGVSLELLTQGRVLCGAGGLTLCAVVRGADVAQLDELYRFGAERVYLLQGAVESLLSTVVRAVERYRPEIFLLGATMSGRQLAPMVAARVGTGLTADCTGLELDGNTGLLLMSRPACGGQLMATIVCPDHRPQMATVRSGVFAAEPLMEYCAGEPVLVEGDDVAAPRMRRLRSVRTEAGEAVDLHAARLVVAGGRGVGGAEGFRLMEALATALDGVVGASRGTVDAGWISSSRLVGQSGKTISPELYVACGISGAIPHVVGMQSAGLVVAINADPTAPIFDVADIGLVGDLHEVVPEWLRQLRDEAVD